MKINYMMIVLIIWTLATGVNYICLKNVLLGLVFICYEIANIFLFIIGNTR